MAPGRGTWEKVNVKSHKRSANEITNATRLCLLHGPRFSSVTDGVVAEGERVLPARELTGGLSRVSKGRRQRAASLPCNPCSGVLS